MCPSGLAGRDGPEDLGLPGPGWNFGVGSGCLLYVVRPKMHEPELIRWSDLRESRHLRSFGGVSIRFGLEPAQMTM